MVILAGHGAGTEEDFLLRDDTTPAKKGIRPVTRQLSQHARLRKVFERVKKNLKIKIDILGMDVCLMSMIEVCYELKGLVEVPGQLGKL